MQRYHFIFLMALICAFTSCVKSGSTKACFTFSKESPKVNDTLYLLNCSEYYSKFIWENSNGFYPSGATIDSINRHQKVVVTSAGAYKVKLRVGKINGFFAFSPTGSTDLEKTITVKP